MHSPTGPDARSPLDRYGSTVAIAAAIFVAVRLARVPDKELTISRVISTVRQGVRLGRTILDEAMRR